MSHIFSAQSKSNIIDFILLLVLLRLELQAVLKDQLSDNMYIVHVTDRLSLITHICWCMVAELR